MNNQRVLYEFDDFTVDSGQFVLGRHGVQRPVTPTVFRILLLLLENAGRVVTKEELLAQIWPDSFVEEGNINRNVSTLRKVLGETPRDHRYIETVPKAGYRFISPVRKLDYQLPAVKASTTQPAELRRVIGRNFERQTLCSIFETAKGSHGGIVAVTGEVGMGKTTLVDAFLEDVAGRGRFHLTLARCSESRTEPEPYGPFMEILTLLMHNKETTALVEHFAPTWHRELTQAADENSLSPGNIGRMKREIVELLQRLSTVHPVVIVLDDFHWADQASVDLLSFLAVRLLRMRVMVVVCMRPDEINIHCPSLGQTRAQLVSSGMMREIDLPPLTRSHVEELVQDKELAATIHARTEGNPLFVVETIRNFSQDAAASTRPDAVPDPLRHLIRSRLAPLSDEDRKLLGAASIQGLEFDSAILAKSLDEKPEEIEGRLQLICETYGLIRRLREEEMSDGRFTVRYRFGHDFCRAVCHEALPPTRKAALNSAVAEAFLAFYG